MMEQLFTSSNAAGFAPLAAVVVPAWITEALARGSGGLNHAQTFSHHAVSCAAGTATLLGLAPLVANNLLACRVIVDAKTGSSGSGAKAAANTHHPQRSNSFYAYKPFVHQHVPEIEQELKSFGDWNNELIFMTHSLPVSRGIFSSIYVETKEELAKEEVK